MAIPTDANGRSFSCLHPLKSHSLSVNSDSSRTPAFDPRTIAVEVDCNQICFIRFGDADVEASGTDVCILDRRTKTFSVGAFKYIAAYGAGSYTVVVTELG